MPGRDWQALTIYYVEMEACHEDQLRLAVEVNEKNKMKKSELAAAAEISGYTMTKLYRDEPVSLEVIMRLCKVFHCDIGDLVEITEE